MWHVGGQTDGQTDRQTDRHTDMNTCMRAVRQTDRQEDWIFFQLMVATERQETNESIAMRPMRAEQWI